MNSKLLDSEKTKSNLAVAWANFRLATGLGIASCLIPLVIYSYLLFGPNQDEVDGESALQTISRAVPLMAVPAIGLVCLVLTWHFQNKRSAYIGAACLMIPGIGPCYGLTIPLGIWLIFILNNEAVDELFARQKMLEWGNMEQGERWLTQAQDLAKAGDLSAALDLYFQVKKQSPDDAEYAQNCIDELCRKHGLDALGVVNTEFPEKNEPVQ